MNERLKRANEAKDLAKSKKKPRKRTIKTVKASCDKLWGEIIRSVGRCQYCGRTDVLLNAHHIFTRERLATRYSIKNGSCLCVNHHTFSSDFSAHKTPVEFTDWLRSKYGTQFIDDLRIESQKRVSMKTDDYLDMEKKLKLVLKTIEG